jgi:hypothetical protein
MIEQRMQPPANLPFEDDASAEPPIPPTPEVPLNSEPVQPKPEIFKPIVREEPSVTEESVQASDVEDVVSQMVGAPSVPKAVFKKPNIGKVLLGLVILGGIVWGVRYYFNVLARDPQVVFFQSIERLQAVQSFASNQEFSLTIDPGSAENSVVPFDGPMTITAKLSTQTVRDGNISQNMIKAVLDIPLVSLLSGDESQDKKTQPEFNIVTTDTGEVFVRVTGIPVTPLFDLTAINDTWVQLDAETAKTYSGGITFAGVSAADAQKMQAELLALYKQYPFFIFTQLPNDTIDGVETLHYVASLDKAIAKQLIVATSVAGAKYGATIPGDPEFIGTELNKVDISFEFWATKKNPILKKIFLTAKLTDGQTKVETIATGQFGGFNRDIVISTPTEFVTLVDAIAKVMAANQPAPVQVGEDGPTIVAVRQLQTALGLYYNDTLRYPIMPIGGNRLGVDAICLTSKGFRKDAADCTGIMYAGALPKHPQSPTTDFVYYLCSDSQYVIAFSLDKDVADHKAGNYFATPKGINAPTEISSGCLDGDNDGLPNFLENRYGTKINEADTDGDSFLDGAEVMNGYNPRGAGELN